MRGSLYFAFKEYKTKKYILDGNSRDCNDIIEFGDQLMVSYSIWEWIGEKYFSGYSSFEVVRFIIKISRHIS